MIIIVYIFAVIMNEEDMMNKAQYTKVGSDCLIAHDQIMMESTVLSYTTEPGLVGGGEEQVDLMKQQLKEKEEEVMN